MTDQPGPSLDALTNAELEDLVRRGAPDRGKAVYLLVDRAKQDRDAAGRLAALSTLPAVRDDRLFHRASLAWVAIIGLLESGELDNRGLAYEAFYAMEPEDRDDLLSYLGQARIEDAHP